MKNKFTFIDLFAGIGGIRLGFEHVGGKCVFSSEWDADASMGMWLVITLEREKKE